MLGKFINHCEDSLTAAVFSNLLHLPEDEFWSVVRNACYSPELPVDAGELVEVEYWPKWAAADSGNANYVEPDLFLRFEQFDLIVEAKRWDDGMQSRDQWERELKAYAWEYGQEERKVRIIALGGLFTEEDDCVSVNWKAEGERLKRALERESKPGDRNLSDRRILADIISLFAFHGFATGRWYNDIPFSSHVFQTPDRNPAILRNLNATFP